MEDPSALETHDAYYLHKGQVPVIFTIPHGISLDDSTCSTLKSRNNGRLIEELHIIELVEATAKHLQETWGYPYLYIARIHRSKIDFARSKSMITGESAYEDPRAEFLFDDFEYRLNRLILSLIHNHPTVILLDVHGCLKKDYDVYLGTRNGKTALSQNNRVFARDTLQKELSRSGWKVAPEPGTREEFFTGRVDSIITRHNLSTHPGRHASIQIEISSRVRGDVHRERFAYDLASAIKAIFFGPSQFHSPLE